MAQGTISPIYDTELENIRSQLAYADALRKKSLDAGGQMVGRHYVAKNPWQNFVEGLAGSAVNTYQRDKQAGMERQQEQARQDWLGQMPAAEAAQVYDPANTPGTGPLDTTQMLPKSAKVYADETRRWALQAPRGMESVQQAAIQRAMLAPEQEQARVERAQAREDELAERYRQAQALQEERLRAAKEAQEARLQSQKELRMLTGSLAASNRTPRTQIAYGPDGKGYLVDMTTGQQTPLGDVGKMPGGKGGKLTPEQAKEAEAASLNELIRRTREVMSAPGLETVTGPIAGRLPGVVYAGDPNASSALSTYDKYLEYLQTAGLEDLKAKGISPGSITEKEWPKFVARKTSLDRVKQSPEVKAELGRLAVDAYNTRSKVAGTGESYHYVGGKIYSLRPGADPKLKSSYTEVTE